MTLPRFGPIGSGLADPATLSGDDVPVAVADYHALQSLFGAPRAVTLPEVPGVHAWVVFNPQVGRQLWVDSRFCPPSLHRRVWEAAFGSLPPGYVVQPFGDPGSQSVALVVIAIIAILIGLLLPAVNSARDLASGQASWVPLSKAAHVNWHWPPGT